MKIMSVLLFPNYASSTDEVTAEMADGRQVKIPLKKADAQALAEMAIGMAKANLLEMTEAMK